MNKYLSTSVVPVLKSPNKRKVFTIHNIPEFIDKTHRLFPSLDHFNLLQKIHYNESYNGRRTIKKVSKNEKDPITYRLNQQAIFLFPDVFYDLSKSMKRKLGFPDVYYQTMLEIFPRKMHKIDPRFNRFIEEKNGIYLIKESIVSFFNMTFDREKWFTKLRIMAYLTFDNSLDEIAVLSRDLTELKNSLSGTKTRKKIVFGDKLVKMFDKHTNVIYEDSEKIEIKNYYRKNTFSRSSITGVYFNRNQLYLENINRLKSEDGWYHICLKDEDQKKYVKVKELPYKTNEEINNMDQEIYHIEKKIVGLTNMIATKKSEYDFQDKGNKKEIFEKHIEMESFLDFVEFFFDILNSHFVADVCETEEEYNEKYKEYVHGLATTDISTLEAQLGITKK